MALSEAQTAEFKKTLPVVVGLISRPCESPVVDDKSSLDWCSESEYLIATREHGPYAGFWEFPGGKVDPGETEYAALCRELREEVDVEVKKARPLFKISSPSGRDPSTLLELSVWDVTQWQGDAYGVEGQAVRWSQLRWEDRSFFLDLNRHMFSALQMKEHMVIQNLLTMDSDEFIAECISHWQKLHSQLPGGCCVRLRSCGLSDQVYYARLKSVLPLVQAAGVSVVIDALPVGYTNDLWCFPVVIAAYFPAWWRSRCAETSVLPLLNFLQKQRPSLLRGVSCHNQKELAWACADVQGPQCHFYCLSPINQTPSHPGVQVLGWDRWAELNRLYPQPGIGLGGLTLGQMDQIKAVGGFGLAGISCFSDHSA